MTQPSQEALNEISRRADHFDHNAPLSEAIRAAIKKAKEDRK